MYERFIARQPIFDRQLNVFGYELFFRDSTDNHFSPTEHATAHVIVDSSMLHRIESLTGTSKAFLNVSPNELHSGAAFLLPRATTVVEISSQSEFAAETIRACEDLHAAGYRLALDDFDNSPRWHPLIPIASFLKFDFRGTSPDEQHAVAQKFSATGLHLIAKKIEWREEFHRASSNGFSYFQGFFFLRPEVLVTRDLPASKLSCLQLLRESSVPEIRYGVVEQLLKQEPALLYKLLRYLNSPSLGLSREVKSVPHAIALLGEKEFRRWVSVVAVVAASMDEPVEVLRSALTRAYFCEGLSLLLGVSESPTEFFLMGLLSLVDVLFSRPIADILAELPLSPKIAVALLGGSNIFRDVYETALAYESADWETFQAVVRRAKFNQSLIAEKYEAAALQASLLPAREH